LLKAVNALAWDFQGTEHCIEREKDLMRDFLQEQLSNFSFVTCGNNGGVYLDFSQCRNDV